MIVESVPVTEYGTNCYVVACPETREGIVIDPGGEPALILDLIRTVGATIKYVVLTHGHIDHVGAVQEIKQATGAPVATHAADAGMLSDPGLSLASWMSTPQPSLTPDLLLDEGDELAVGTLRFRVLHTPGHTPGHISLVVDRAIFCGDVLFFMGIGRTDFPGGDYEALMHSIMSKLVPLGEDVHVYSGHGPATTIGLELEHNPWIAGGEEW